MATIDSRARVLASGFASIAIAGVAIGSPEASAQSREIYRVKVPSPTEGFGCSLAGLDDLDGDGIAEFAVGADQGGPTSNGRVYVYRGADGSLIRTHDSPNSGGYTYYGHSIERLDDLDGDGVGEYAILERLTGRIEFHSGADGSLLRVIQIDGWSGEQRVDQGLRLADDIDGDGDRDLIFQQPGVDGLRGRVNAISASSGTVLWQLYGEGYRDEFGAHVLSVGDVDGDGVGDLLVDAPYRLPSGGTVYLYSAKSHALLWRIDGTYLLGEALADAGDVNSDGVADILITHDVANLRQCEMISGIDGSHLGDFVPGDSLDSVFTDVGALADADGDGDLDCVLPETNGVYGASDTGLLCVWEPRQQVQLARSELVAGWAQMGFVATLGDVDGDGFVDFAYVEPEHDAIVLTFRSPPGVKGVTPSRGRYGVDTPVTITGSGFQLAQGLTVDLGGTLATDVAIVDDAALTCTVPAGTTGPIDVTVSDDAGSATLANGFARTPAVELDGDFTIGGSFTARYLCDPGDTLFAIAGAPPAVSIHVAPFDFELEIAPFLILFIQPNVGADEFDVPITIPNDPALSGAQVLFQALAGPKLGGKGKSGAWTNAAQLQIQ